MAKKEKRLLNEKKLPEKYRRIWKRTYEWCLKQRWVEEPPTKRQMKIFADATIIGYMDVDGD